jgi:cytoskeletal protein CcmA (bactofilin family)
MAFGSKKKNTAPRQQSRPDPVMSGSQGSQAPQGSQGSQAKAGPGHQKQPRHDQTTLGRSLRITGELTGHEDVTINGNVEGKASLPDNVLTIGEPGHIQGEVHAKSVIVIGSVVGNIVADDRVEVAATGSVQGDICAPRVIIAEGARFKGKVDMPDEKLGHTVDTFDKPNPEEQQLVKAIDSFDIE